MFAAIEPPLPSSFQPRDLAIADLDSDTRPDLAVADLGIDALAVYLASGAPGEFAGLTQLKAGSQPRAVAIGDLDGDGNPDLVHANEGSNDLGVTLADDAVDVARVLLDERPLDAAVVGTRIENLWVAPAGERMAVVDGLRRP